MKIKYSAKFFKDIKKLKIKFKNITRDIEQLEKKLISGERGDLISGLSGKQVYKIRQKNSSTLTGKSGGFRVIYFLVNSKNELIMLTIYSKTDKSDISKSEILEILSNIK